VTAATRAIAYNTNTSELPLFPDDYNFPEDRAVDILDFLQYAFGFQVCNSMKAAQSFIF
jgi:callose synthase